MVNNTGKGVDPANGVMLEVVVTRDTQIYRDVTFDNVSKARFRPQRRLAADAGRAGHPGGHRRWATWCRPGARAPATGWWRTRCW